MILFRRNLLELHKFIYLIFYVFIYKKYFYFYLFINLFIIFLIYFYISISILNSSEHVVFRALQDTESYQYSTIYQIF